LLLEMVDARVELVEGVGLLGGQLGLAQIKGKI
jgi:hypothetical protein